MKTSTQKITTLAISGLALLVAVQLAIAAAAPDAGHDHHNHEGHEHHDHEAHMQMLAALQNSTSNSTPAPAALVQEPTTPATPASAANQQPGQIISVKPKEESTSQSITITDVKQLFTNTPRVIIDLSHPLENKTLYWPALPSGFQYESFHDGERKTERNDSYYVKSDGFRMGVHCGTHLDAPVHFNKAGWTVEQIPLERLVDVPVKVIDVSEKVTARRNYSFVKEDFFTKDTNQSLVAPNSVVLMYTGISQLYNQGAEAYFGTKGSNISEMVIPGFSQEAAEYLASVGVYGVGLDAASADSSERHGANSTIDPVAHKIFNGHNIFILENVSNKLADLLKQKTPMNLMIAPLAITGGSGSPIRLIAVSSSHGHSESAPLMANSAPTFSLTSSWMISLVSFVAIIGLYARPAAWLL